MRWWLLGYNSNFLNKVANHTFSLGFLVCVTGVLFPKCFPSCFTIVWMPLMYLTLQQISDRKMLLFPLYCWDFDIQMFRYPAEIHKRKPVVNRRVKAWSLETGDSSLFFVLFCFLFIACPLDYSVNTLNCQHLISHPIVGFGFLEM